MKRTLLAIMVCLFAATTQTQAQTLIHYWNFNAMTGKYNIPNIPNFKADYSVIDVNKTGLVYALSARGTYLGYVDTLQTSAADSDIYNLRTIGGVATPAGLAYRLRNPTDSVSLVFYIPSTNYKNLVFSYDVESSGTTSGIHTNSFSYSTDSGSTWKTTGLDHLSDSTVSITGYTGPQCVFKKITVTFTSADTTVNNNPRLAFKITPSSTPPLGKDTGTKGNDRFDNVTLDGLLIPTAVNNVTATNTAINVYPNPATVDVTIATGTTTEKTVMVYNVAGQMMYNAIVNTASTTVSTSAFANGMYYVLVHNNATGDNSTAKFIKK